MVVGIYQTLPNPPTPRASVAVGQWDVMTAMEAGDSQARKDQVGPGVTAQFSQAASNSAGEVH